MTLEVARQVAFEAHDGQKDKAGVPYIFHPIIVASMVETEDEKIVAFLHDVIEDSNITIDDLKELGFSNPITEAVFCITKTDGIKYEEYLEVVKSNPIARVVKIADLTHNSMISRIANPAEKDVKRTNKYAKAIKYLQM